MNLFNPDIVAFGDIPGLGKYEVGHYLQHRLYASVLIGKSIYIPDYPILHIVGDSDPELQDFLNSHEILHELLRGYARVTGTNLSQLDPQSPDAWSQWQDAHRWEHIAFDQAFGTGAI